MIAFDNKLATLARTPKGGFKYAVINALCGTCTPEKGWFQRVIHSVRDKQYVINYLRSVGYNVPNDIDEQQIVEAFGGKVVDGECTPIEWIAYNTIVPHIATKQEERINEKYNAKKVVAKKSLDLKTSATNKAFVLFPEVFKVFNGSTTDTNKKKREIYIKGYCDALSDFGM